MKIIIDTDPGIDDAIAVFMAFASPELEIVGLTSVYGNLPIDITTMNALRFVELAGRTDIPVARGTGRPLVADDIGPVPFIHGDNGLGNAPVAEPTGSVSPLHAAEFIYQAALANPGELTLVPVGPLTNLALAVRLHPDLVDLVAGVVIMGGAVYTSGNASPGGEANILHDPEAAEIVLGEQWPVTMVGLDVTNSVALDHDQLSAISAVDSPPNELLGAAMPFYQRFYEENLEGFEGLCPHDAVAIAYLLQPDLFETVRKPLRVEVSGFGRGKTWPAEPFHLTRPDSPWVGRPETTICTSCESDAVAELITTRLTS
ncbi:MAG: nucleoside hydrolase [Acidimicrobiales bacterium]